MVGDIDGEKRILGKEEAGNLGKESFWGEGICEERIWGGKDLGERRSVLGIKGSV